MRGKYGTKRREGTFLRPSSDGQRVRSEGRRESEGGRTRGRPGGARFNTSSLVRAFTLTSDRQIKLNDTRIVKGRRRSATMDGCTPATVAAGGQRCFLLVPR